MACASSVVGGSTGPLVDGGGLNDSNLVLAEGLADDIEPARERGVAEGPIGFARKRGADSGRQRLFRVSEVALGPGERRSNGANGVTGAVRWPPPRPSGQG